ncbi:MAG: Trigger factor [Opitutia bacterium UBA7350]|nr:MAG: Trigger factor [Opitutae bacterium UBA7350]
MKTESKDINSTRKAVSVHILAEEINEIEAQLVSDFQGQAKIPGFRPGKAPEKMVRSRYAKDLKKELANRVVSKAHEGGIQGADYEVYGIVDLKEGDIIAGQDAIIEFTVDIIPSFELPSYEGLKVSSSSVEPTAEEVDAMLDQILGQRAEFKEVEKPAVEGNYVRCGYEGSIDEKPLTETYPELPSIYGTQKTTWEEAGAKESPGVRAIIDGVVGMKAGDEKSVTMDFPEDFEMAELAGKSVIYVIKVEEVREKIMPKMDAAFFEALKVKDEAELREQITENIKNQKQQQNFQEERQQITDQLLQAVDLELPQSGVDNETEALLRDFMQRNMQQGASEADFEKNKAALHASASKSAIDRMKSRIILGKIAEKEKIKAENDDFSRLIMQEAMQTGQKPEKLVKDIQKDQSRINRMRLDILMGKTMDKLLETAERETVETPAQGESQG